MAETGRDLPGPLLPGDATRLVAAGFAVAGVLILFLGTTLLILVRDFVYGLGFGIYEYLILAVPITLAGVVGVAAGFVAIAYGLVARKSDAWYRAAVVSGLLVLVGWPVAVTAGGAGLTVPAIGGGALLALWTDRSLFDLDGRFRR